MMEKLVAAPLQLDDAKRNEQSFKLPTPTASNRKTITQTVTCQSISPLQDSFWSWVVCFAAVTSNILICGFTFSYGILFPSLLDEFHQGKASTAWVGSLAMMGVGIYGPIVGKLHHRFGARIVAFFGSIICVFSLIATSRAPNLYVMFITYGALFGFGSCGIYIITYIAVPRYFVKWRSLSLGLIAMGPGGGLFIMSPLVQVLLETYGWRGTFLAMSGIISTTCVMAFVYLPITLESDKVEVNADRKDDNKFWDISVLKYKKFVLCACAATVYYLVHYTPTVHMVRYIEEIGFTEVKASRLYIYGGITSLLSRPVIGRMNDLTWVNAFYIYTVATTLEGLATFLLPMAVTRFHFVVYFVVSGLADGTMGCGIAIAVLKSLPERLRPLGICIYNCLSSTVSACGPGIGGLIADVTGSYVPVFHMAGSLVLAAAGMLLGVSCIKEPDKLRTKQQITVCETLVVVEKCSVV